MQRIKKSEIEAKAMRVSEALDRKIFIYSAYGTFSVRENRGDGSSNIMGSVGTMRDVDHFLNGMIATMEYRPKGL